MSGSVLRFPNNELAATTQEKTGFTSYKCAFPIRYGRRCSRDALIQATLDPKIESIEPYFGATECPNDTFFTFAVITNGQRCAIYLTDTSQGKVPPPHGCVAAVAVDRARILAEPALTTARMIWRHRDGITPPIFVVRLLRRLKQEPAGIPLIDLEDDLVDEPRRWVDYTLTAACQGLVTLDHRRPLTDLTVIRLGPLAQTTRTIETWLT